MKAVLLAGGWCLGTRLSEETDRIPKPMVEIGGRPILWHIMKSFSAHGINDFVVCLGYKGYIIKEFFQNYYLHSSDVTDRRRESLWLKCIRPPEIRGASRSSTRATPSMGRSPEAHRAVRAGWSVLHDLR